MLLKEGETPKAIWNVFKNAPDSWAKEAKVVRFYHLTNHTGDLALAEALAPFKVKKLPSKCYAHYSVKKGKHTVRQVITNELLCNGATVAVFYTAKMDKNGEWPVDKDGNIIVTIGRQVGMGIAYCSKKEPQFDRAKGRIKAVADGVRTAWRKEERRRESFVAKAVKTERRVVVHNA